LESIICPTSELPIQSSIFRIKTTAPLNYYLKTSSENKEKNSESCENNNKEKNSEKEENADCPKKSPVKSVDSEEKTNGGNCSRKSRIKRYSHGKEATPIWQKGQSRSPRKTWCDPSDFRELEMLRKVEAVKTFEKIKKKDFCDG